MNKKRHYVDNEKFFEEIKKWKQRVIDAREVDEKDPDHRNLRFTKPDWFIAQYENTLSGPNQLLLDDDW